MIWASDRFDLRTLPVPAFLLRPPYEVFEPVRLDLVASANLERGAVLALAIEEPACDAEVVVNAVPFLRVAFPANPIAFRVRRLSQRAAVDLGYLAAKVQVRAILFDGDRLAATLRDTLTDPELLAGDVTAWLELMIPALSDFSRLVVARVLAGGAGSGGLGEILEPLGLGSDRTIRARIRDEHLPPLRHWQHLARALYSLLSLQRLPPACSLAKHAQELGYGDRGVLIRQLWNAFRAAPRAVRRTVGWEPWMTRWMVHKKSDGYFPSLQWHQRH